MVNKSLQIVAIILFMFGSCQDVNYFQVERIDYGIYNGGYFVGFAISVWAINKDGFELMNSKDNSPFYMQYEGKPLYPYNFNVSSMHVQNEDNIYLKFLIKESNPTEADIKSIVNDLNLFYGEFPTSSPIRFSNNFEAKYFGWTDIVHNSPSTGLSLWQEGRQVCDLSPHPNPFFYLSLIVLPLPWEREEKLRE